MGFIHMTLIDLIDIVVVAAILFQIYRLTRGTNALRIVVGILMVYLLWILVRLLKMELLSMILGQIIGVGVIALIVVFQPEVRRFLLLLGTQYARRKNTIFGRFFKSRDPEVRLEWIDPVVDACSDMAMNIFFKNSPLHDGAIVLANERIVAAKCMLPSTEREMVPAEFGTRHRAALGISEITDALVIVVSEERGTVSVARKGHIRSPVPRTGMPDIPERRRKTSYGSGRDKEQPHRTAHRSGALDIHRPQHDCRRIR